MIRDVPRDLVLSPSKHQKKLKHVLINSMEKTGMDKSFMSNYLQ